MNRRQELLDVAAQTADHNRAERDEWRAAARYDRRDWVKVGGTWRDSVDVPDKRDLIDLDD